MTKPRNFLSNHFDIMSNGDAFIIHNIVFFTETLVTSSCRNIGKMNLVAARPSHTHIARMAVAKHGVG
jgi:hypothetical protein